LAIASDSSVCACTYCGSSAMAFLYQRMASRIPAGVRVVDASRPFDHAIHASVFCVVDTSLFADVSPSRVATWPTAA
jgi:hypothetical protein